MLNQGYPNLEYIIMDGGSSDNSVEIIKKYEKYLTYWTSEKDGGQYDAISRGFARSTGDILAWLNSDDLYCPWSLRTVGEVFAQLPEVQWLSTLFPGLADSAGHCLGFNHAAGYARQAFLDGAYLPPYSRSICWIQQESTFWRRGLWVKAGGIDAGMKLAADFDLWSRFYRHADLYGLSSPLACFRLQDQQKSMRMEEYLDEAVGSLDSLRQYFHWKPSLLRRVALKLRINEIPMLRSLLTSRYHYQGQKIERDDPRRRDAKWVVEEHTFFHR